MAGSVKLCLVVLIAVLQIRQEEGAILGAGERLQLALLAD